ncbi:MAG: hypothetical protein A2010_17330 [Nitrospirae bacterium GWD2_57_9]|nr:MAG: hypothetical protein A2010_17330 [Nitrospirae bacterium GWD2_57_9]OGW45216.1 MAG: hypothetical protein A2078_12005 [Nitrospirae bacterium GWC2_57_9]
MTDELFDILDCTGRKTGKTIERNEAHRSGAWHGAFHCLIVYTREGRPYAWFQKRSASKKIAPGRFDVSVGGHYAAGEDARIAGPREIGEELGLRVEFPELVPVGRRVFVYCFTRGVTEYEFQDVYLLPSTEQPRDVLLQDEEVEGLLEMDVEAGISLFNGGVTELECRMLAPDRLWKKRVIRAEEFVPCLDNYYLKLLLLARRYFQGERKLLVI